MLLCRLVWKTSRMVWLYAMVKNKHMITRFDTIHERDGRTDNAQTDTTRWQWPQLYIASRGNNTIINLQ